MHLPRGAWPGIRVPAAFAATGKTESATATRGSEPIPTAGRGGAWRAWRRGRSSRAAPRRAATPKALRIAPPTVRGSPDQGVIKPAIAEHESVASRFRPRRRRCARLSSNTLTGNDSEANQPDPRIPAMGVLKPTDSPLGADRPADRPGHVRGARGSRFAQVQQAQGVRTQNGSATLQWQCH